MICETLLERYIRENLEIGYDVYINHTNINNSELEVEYFTNESSKDKSITINIWEMLMFINRES